MKKLIVLFSILGILFLSESIAQEEKATKKKLEIQKKEQTSEEKPEKATKKKLDFESIKKKQEKSTAKKVTPKQPSGKEPVLELRPGAKKPIPGEVVSLKALVSESEASINEGQARSLVNDGQPLLFRDKNGNIYWVYNVYGKIPYEKMISYAGKQFSIVGDVREVNGVKVIVASKYVSSSVH